ncbi:hypothetical protein THII_0696 [Thioploca ingrica]|uniref:Uncharacterized protein n=1 Tax=Thioploca ingrica TaxID=40754 RepID=A0A090ABJ2_9GAMM|nr:hypothetical protein THII_0696 [Thioploca ingrica]
MLVFHEAASFLKNSGFLPHDENNPKVLSSNYVPSLTEALHKDAAGYLYNGVLSVGTGIKSLLQNNYGWATVKLYYSVFYLARAKLAINDFCILYEDSKPFVLLLRFNETLKKPSAYIKGISAKQYVGTHKLVLTLFQREFSGDLLLSNNIDGKSPLVWLMEQRELMNYKAAVMPDPEIPWQYAEIATKQIRQWLNIYLDDEIPIYPFDHDHACLAYPVQFLLKVIDEFNDREIPCSYLQENSNFIKKLFSDKSGVFNGLANKFNSL